MMVKKFVGKNTRETLRQVREALGPDAMILSSKQTPQGLEMVAMASQEMESLVAGETTFAPINPAAMPRRRIDQAAEHERHAQHIEQRSASVWEEHSEGVSFTQTPQSTQAVATAATANNFAHRSSVGQQALRGFAQQISQDETSQIVRGVAQTSSIKAEQPAVWRNQRGHEQRQYAAHEATKQYAVSGMAASNLQPDPMMDLSRAVQMATATQAQQQLQETAQLLHGQKSAAQVNPQLLNSSDVDSSLLEELKSMRSMLESQMSGMAWREAIARNPLRAQCWRRLVEAGFSPMLARVVVEHLPDDFQAEQAQQWLLQVLLRNLPQMATGEDLVERGGIWALVGPTGVGKTTTTAKLAARCVVKYGAESLGLITTDTYRVGAHDQLKIYAKILGVQVFTAHAASDLDSMLNFMQRKRLVLIDTVGMGQRDQRVPEQISMLGRHEISRLLLLNAAAQPEALEDVAQAYRGKPDSKGLAGALITKLDEAVKLGGVLDIVMRHKLPLHFVTNGQRVPEDLHPANAQMLLHRALKATAAPSFGLSELEFDIQLAAAGEKPLNQIAHQSRTTGVMRGKEAHATLL